MEQLLSILEEIKPGFVFTGRADLVDSGDLDSFDVISLVGELNDAFDIDIPVEAIVPENFNSVDAMMALINQSSKTNSAGSKSGATASPAGVISPSRTSLLQRSRFCSHQLLRLRRGVKCCMGLPSSIRFMVLSIQPKQSATSTASTYRTTPGQSASARFMRSQKSLTLS